jgi:ADP-heptose:LPS heptosyltransferase
MTMGEATLVVSRKQLGDLLLLLPAMEHLHREEGCELYVQARGNFAALYELMPCRPRPVADFPGDAFDRLYCFEAGKSTSLFCAWARSRRKTLGLTRPDLAWWQRRVFDDFRVRDASSAYRGAVFHALAGGDPERFAPPALDAPPADWLPADLPARYYVLHPTAAWQRKTWDVAGWRGVVVELHRRLGLTCVLTSGPADWEVDMAASIATALDAPVLNLAGRTGLKQYLAVLSRAAGTLCIDGSASHLSAAFGRPTLTLFGPTNPLHWHWPTPATPRLYAGDFVAEKKPPASAIPRTAVRDAALELLGSGA